MALGAKLGQVVSWALGASGWKPPMEDFLRTMDAIVQCNAQGWTSNPEFYGANSITGTWIVGEEYDQSAPQAIGLFAGRKRGDIATWQSDLNSWFFVEPKTGWRAAIRGELMQFGGGEWYQVVPVKQIPPRSSIFIGYFSELGGVDDKVYGLSYYSGTSPEDTNDQIYAATFAVSNPQGAILGLRENSGSITQFIPQYPLVDKFGAPIAAGVIAAGETKLLLYNSADGVMMLFDSFVNTAVVSPPWPPSN